VTDLEGADVPRVVVKLLADILHQGPGRADEGRDALAAVALEGMDLEMTQEPVISAIILQRPVVNRCHGTCDRRDQDIRKAGI